MKNNRFFFDESIVKVIFESPKEQSFKFGYYNYSPINKSEDKLLAHKISFEGRNPFPADKVEIGYFRLDTKEWIKLAESSAFNWQQGSMLQWLGPDFDREIIFNDAENNQYISRIINVNTKEERKINRAIYGVSPDGKFSISLNFERCNFTRAYSYASVIREDWKEKIPERDGILKINLATGESQTIISLKDIVQKLGSDTSIVNKAHWFEHIMLNPTGSRFAFYHRYGENVGFKTLSYTSDINGNNIWLHPMSEAERVTHLGWRNEKQYVLYTVTTPKVKQLWLGKKKKVKWYVKAYRKLVKPFVPRTIISKLPQPKSYYALTKDMDGVEKKINPLPRNMDGHPSFTKDGRFMLTDTYSDNNNYRNLLIFDLEKGKTHIIGKFFSTFNNCSWRADLHPRFSPDERKIIIDTSHNGYHQLLVFKVDWDALICKR